MLLHDDVDKTKTATEKALRTATWAKTMTKVVISQNNSKPPFWHVVNFLGPGKQESRGIVDLLAIRKDHREPAASPNRGDLFEVVLIQVKGSSAKRPSSDDRKRLSAVVTTYNATAIILSEWKKGALRICSRVTKVGFDNPPI